MKFLAVVFIVYIIPMLGLYALSLVCNTKEKYEVRAIAPIPIVSCLLFYTILLFSPATLVLYFFSEYKISWRE